MASSASAGHNEQASILKSLSRTSLVATAVSALIAAVLFALLWHASPERCFRMFQNVWIVLLVLLAIARVCGRSIEDSSQIEPVQSHERWILPAALISAAVVYLGTLHFSFVSDDYTLLEMAKRPFSAAMHEYFFVGQVDSSGAAIFYRPLAFATVNIEYLLWGASLPAYHLACIAVHVVCVLALFRLCREMDLPHRLSATAALIFAVLPTNAQAITWPTARFDRFAVLAMVWCLVLYVRSRRTGSWLTFAFSAVLLLVAVECKEFAFVLPVLALCADLALGLAPPLRRQAMVRVAVFFAMTAAAFLWRMRLIGGIGGYHTAGGDPSVLHLGRAFKAVFVRAPGETLFGYNWLHPFGAGFLLVTAATAALLVFLSATYRAGRFWRISLFSVALIVLPVAPGHFLFWWPDPGLVFSRALYFSAAGMALLLALILERWSNFPRFYYVATAALVVLFTLALQHNVDAWRYNSLGSGRFLSELKRAVPSPRANQLLCIDDLPTHVHGVQFFDVNPTAAARYVFGDSSSLAVQRASDGCANNAAATQLIWSEATGTLSKK